MARGDYTPEIKSSMGGNVKAKVKTSPPKESPADMMRDKQLGIKEDSPQDAKIDAQPANQMPMKPTMPGMQGMPPDAHHVAAAAGIAHAILGNRGMR